MGRAKPLFVWVGTVDHYDAVHAKRVSKGFLHSHTHTWLDLARGNTFRYVEGTNVVVWWDAKGTKEAQHAAENFFSKKGFDITHHSNMDSYRDLLYDVAHGDKPISKLPTKFLKK